jgi:hypothetical protein
MINNTVLNNKYINNPNNGGSGLNITCNSTGEGIIAKAYMQGNHIEGNVWGVTVIGNVEINAGYLEEAKEMEYNPGENVFINNGNGDPFVKYDFYNNTAATSYAQGNTWNVEVQDFEHIAEVVVDKADNAALGEVIYMPAGSQTAINTINVDNNGSTQRYNILGQPVDSNYRGIVIEKGKKILVK